jgi:hypothetical protein
MDPLLFVLPMSSLVMQKLTQPPSVSRSTQKSSSLHLNIFVIFFWGTAISPNQSSNTSIKHLKVVTLKGWKDERMTQHPRGHTNSQPGKKGVFPIFAKKQKKISPKNQSKNQAGWGRAMWGGARINIKKNTCSRLHAQR